MDELPAQHKHQEANQSKPKNKYLIPFVTGSRIDICFSTLFRSINHQIAGKTTRLMETHQIDST